jgi:glycine/D-amino acid oxidase-like deaminating enzyme
MAQYDIWTQQVTKARYPTLKTNLQTDVAIIGGGLAGILSAYLLAKEGKKVALLEQNELGSGATHLTTAFLTQSIDTDFSDLIDTFGKEKAKLIVDSHQKAIDLIEKIAKDNNIECEFERCSNYSYANAEEDLEDLETEYEAAKELGLHITLSKKPGDFGFVNFGYLELKNQAKFHPMKFMYALAEILALSGTLIFEYSKVLKTDFDITPHQIKTKTGMIEAGQVIVTTYEPFNKPLKLYFKKAFYNSYVLEVEFENMQEFKEGIYEDLEDPYHYIRIDKKRMIIGGEDHRQDIPVSAIKNFKALEEYLKCILKSDKENSKRYTITRKWAGPILEPVDGLAYIGQLDHDTVFYAMAFSGNGMTYSGISAMIFRDLILKKKNPLIDVYAARRIPSLKSLQVKGRDYGRELIHGAMRNTLKFRKRK